MQHNGWYLIIKSGSGEGAAVHMGGPISGMVRRDRIFGGTSTSMYFQKSYATKRDDDDVLKTLPLRVRTFLYQHLPEPVM